MAGHLNSDQDNGIILMMPGLPVSRLEALVGHWVRRQTIIPSDLAQVSTRPGEALTRIDQLLERGRPLLIQDQHIAETQIRDHLHRLFCDIRYLYLELAVTSQNRLSYNFDLFVILFMNK